MLTLPSSYNSALGQAIKENYLVQINNELGVGKYLSVSDTTVSSINYSGVITNLPQIREKIDLFSSKASLSNVSITCANSNLDDLLLSTRTYLNRDVRIYSQLDEESNLSNCLLIFKGILRSVQQTENKITLQISSKRPFENIKVPNVESVNGNYVPIVFGDYTSHTFATTFLGTKLQNTTINCHPVPVDFIKEGKLIALSSESNTSTINTGFLHEIEEDLFRTTGSENLTKLGGTLLNNEAQETFKALDGTTDIFGRSGQINLRRGMSSLCGVTAGDFGGTTAVSSDKTTISVNSTYTNQGNTITKSFTMDEIGSVKHTPEQIQLNLNFSNVSIEIDDFTSYQVKADVYWGSSATPGVSNYELVSRAVGEDLITSIADISAYFITPNAVQENTITNDSDNSGNLPQKVVVKFVFNSSANGPNTYDIDFDCQPEFHIVTQLDESAVDVQSTSDILNDIKTLYSGQDGHTLSGESTIIRYPIEAHRYLCETFMPTEFSSTRPASYTNLRAYQVAHGQCHYYITKQQKIEDELNKLQHLGGFIMRYKNDGTYDYISPSYLTTSTTASNTSPYLLNIGTLQTASGSGINATDATLGVDITHASETLANGDIIAIEKISGYFEFIKVFLTDIAISGADQAFSQCERNLIFSNINTSFSENTTIYKVKFPHTKLTDNDFRDMQISHLPLDKIITKYKINYHRDPSDTNSYLEQKTFDDSTNRAKYNLSTENIKEVKNEIDIKGNLSDFYYKHYGFMTSQPRIQISVNIVNPDFYSIEVGDIIKLDGANVTQNPFGLVNKGYTATTAWDRLNFIVTSTSRTMGKMSINAYELF